MSALRVSRSAADESDLIAALQFLVSIAFLPASLYPLLHRLETRGLIKGRWVEAAGKKRRRFYTLTAAGRRELAAQRSSWTAFMQGIRLTAGLQDA